MTSQRRTIGKVQIAIVLLFSSWGFRAWAQAPGAYASDIAAQSAPAQLLSPDQLDNLVAPVALYPDQLLSQVLAASTYPLEIVEAQQWLQQYGNLQGAQLIEAAKQQNWDPSVQALVAFPDAVAMLARDVQWTTALGNAFLAQQADVINAIQRLRARAQNNGRLANTAQQVVTMQAQDGQNAIEIQPANPQTMYVPSYNPQYVWGPPAYGEYPPLAYPPVSSGFGFGQLINLASMFTGFGGIAGLLTGGWGWVLSWFTHSLLFNGLFFSHFGFHGGSYGGGGFGGGYGGGYGGFGGAGYGARSAWVHDPGHRMGVPYSNQAVAGRFGGTFRPTTYGSAAYGSAHALSSGGSFSQGHSFGGASSGASRPAMGGGWHSASNGGSFGGASGRGFKESSSGSGAFRSGGLGSSASGFGASANRGLSSFGNGFGTSSRAGYGSGEAGYRGSPTSTYASNFGNGYRSSFSNNFENRGGAVDRSWGSSTRSAFSSSAPSEHFASRGASNFAASTQHFSEQRSTRQISAPRTSSQHFSAPHMSAPHFSAPHSSGGHGGGGHSSGGKSHGGGGSHRK